MTPNEKKKKKDETVWKGDLVDLNKGKHFPDAVADESPSPNEKKAANDTAINPSYDKSLPFDKRLADFLGKYHISLNGVISHQPFYLDCEGKPHDRCDTEDKKAIIEFVTLIVKDELATAEKRAREETIKKINVWVRKWEDNIDIGLFKDWNKLKSRLLVKE